MLLIRLPAVSKHRTDITHLFFMSPDAPINTNKITKEQSERPCSPVYLLLISSWSCTAVRRTGVRKPRRYIVNNGCVKLTLGRCCCWRTTLTQNHVSHHRITRRKKEKKKKKTKTNHKHSCRKTKHTGLHSRWRTSSEGCRVLFPRLNFLLMVQLGFSVVSLSTLHVHYKRGAIS